VGVTSDAVQRSSLTMSAVLFCACCKSTVRWSSHPLRSSHLDSPDEGSDGIHYPKSDSRDREGKTVLVSAQAAFSCCTAKMCGSPGDKVGLPLMLKLNLGDDHQERQSRNLTRWTYNAPGFCILDEGGNFWRWSFTDCLPLARPKVSLSMFNRSRRELGRYRCHDT
jgi:hypothetical protein